MHAGSGGRRAAKSVPRRVWRRQAAPAQHAAMHSRLRRVRDMRRRRKILRAKRNFSAARKLRTMRAGRASAQARSMQGCLMHEDLQRCSAPAPLRPHPTARAAAAGIAAAQWRTQTSHEQTSYARARRRAPGFMPMRSCGWTQRTRVIRTGSCGSDRTSRIERVRSIRRDHADEIGRGDRRWRWRWRWRPRRDGAHRPASLTTVRQSPQLRSGDISATTPRNSSQGVTPISQRRQRGRVRRRGVSAGTDRFMGEAAQVGKPGAAIGQRTPKGDVWHRERICSDVVHTPARARATPVRAGPIRTGPVRNSAAHWTAAPWPVAQAGMPGLGPRRMLTC